jgi:membrane protein YdbS with pleckstrin-like domain
MKSILDFIISTRGSKLRKALEETPQNQEEKKQRIDYLRATVPLNLCLMVAAGILILLRIAGGVGTWYHYCLSILALWYLISSAAVLIKAKKVLRDLE